MRAAPHKYRRRALNCAKRAASCASPSLRQKFADLANVWLMLAVQLEEYAGEDVSPPEAAITAPALQVRVGLFGCGMTISESDTSFVGPREGPFQL